MTQQNLPPAAASPERASYRGRYGMMTLLFCPFACSGPGQPLI